CLQDRTRRGREFCRALSAATDAWIAELAASARARHPGAPRFALVAIGGYGRGELAPFSDIDVLLVYSGKARALEPVASALWYPIWDAGLKRGHAVRTLDEQIELAKSDLDTATALLTARFLAGDAKLAAAVAEAGRENWAKRKKRWLDALRDGV